ncbi:hypothetical protein M3638_01285 [Oceanobacillus profundus]|uniref:hypothetical protein n=1 Tax=Oceanobacillus profundus TaxID=372463 RepID=UPI00203CEF6F|nr:hypothetical protein [Oceanobacillus profundus]MCM3396467.1 hypothetical protein [Oceanobacillus profundus]
MANNYKQFRVKNRNDYSIYLRQLIIQVKKSLLRMYRYKNELQIEVEKLDLLNNPEVKINSEVYEEWNDKFISLSTRLLNLIGDSQKASLSYYKFRKVLVKRNEEVRNLLGTLPKEINELLNSANVSRNWALHQPESLLISHLENIKELWPSNEVERYFNVFTPVYYPTFETYEGKWLESLFNEVCNNYECHKEAFDYMVNDYEKLIESHVTILENRHKLRPFESEIILPKISFDIQQGKYK